MIINTAASIAFGQKRATGITRPITIVQARTELLRLCQRRPVGSFQTASGKTVHAETIIVGKPSTPTPRGEFFVEESVLLSATAAGAPFALALSARSDVLQEFAGGPGQIALHGLASIGGTLGTAVSHGCIRVGDVAIRWLAANVGPGVPVTITG